MATSLYDLSVASYLQTVGAVAGFLDRAAKQCAETGPDPDDFVGARLFEDMAPFHFQTECVDHHSVWALEAVKSGLFAYDRESADIHIIPGNCPEEFIWLNRNSMS
jgi:uncharacterized protein